MAQGTARLQQRQKRALEDEHYGVREQASIKEQREGVGMPFSNKGDRNVATEEISATPEGASEQQEETLLEVLNQFFSSDEPVRQALFDTRSNQTLLLRGFKSLDIKTRPDYILSARERRHLVDA